jgi:ABC-type multidrug transport system fused ATPase/permease subunit
MFANSYSSAAAVLEKISGVLDERPAVGDTVQPVVLPVPVRGEVVFDGVRFSYGGPAPALPQRPAPTADYRHWPIRQPPHHLAHRPRLTHPYPAFWMQTAVSGTFLPQSASRLRMLGGG